MTSLMEIQQIAYALPLQTMEIQDTLNGLALTGAQDHLFAFLLGMPRISMILTIAPFFGGGIITGQLRATLAFSLYLVLHPALTAQVGEMKAMGLSFSVLLGGLLAKEAFLGFLMGWLSGILFWTAQAAGDFIDNQRGASMAQATDPLSGDETTPMGSLFFQGSLYLFFSGGAFLAFIGALYASYEVWPATAVLPEGMLSDARIPLFFAGQLAWLMSGMIILSGPIVVACLLADVSLALINRAAQQLNVYVLAMPIKSALAAFLLLFYFGMVMSDMRGMFSRIMEEIGTLARMIPGN